MSHASRKTHENESLGIHDLPATRVRRSGRIYWWDEHGRDAIGRGG